MSAYKFACPVCGQHITTDSALRILQMECPTCFRNLHVPPPPPGGDHTLVLTTSVVSNRPVPAAPAEKTAPAPVAKKIPVVPIVAVVVLVGALGIGAFLFKDRIFGTAQSEAQPTNSVAKDGKAKSPGYVPPKNDPNWSLNLSKLKFPETPAGGRINGNNFAVEKATLQGGTLTFRQGSGKVADLGLTINLVARQGQDLAGQVLAIEKDVDQAVKVTLRWKSPDDPEKSVQKSYSKGYAMRLAFGEVTGKQIPGKIYLCTPDKPHSYVAGTFLADIRKPAAPKAATTTTTKPKTNSADAK